ncbi:ABC transporter ATP-binding protein [Halapricum hydrolyticum]|uniref:Molybdate/tungstate import ATP-binding protein WtpC n=1 Tax=Halapricum hydrolyticum TaxID=2979991 RepID=A0AAE3I8C8_9EURY|nr:ABC transporter ATP-binding protein [Halapricum hydrolyticum]MCU4716847.1 ABC transporter ATP-binding protein [Halapricum hydrolyticum]MCU4725548.1 ABC transporter ATP-binding protein [Halapricum hydrolyticum]
MTLEVDGLTHRYGNEPALEDVSFEIDAGEVVGLLGPSGCGKTTTVQAIAGHVSPTEGQVRLRGRNVTTDPPETRDVGVVFQESTLFPHMTVGENVAYGLRPAGYGPDERAAIVDRYLELVSLSDQREAMPAALSGGQKRRAELARALAPQPEVLLLDEPLSALDRGLRDRLREEIARIQRETGVTTLYVTHDQETAMALADRLVVMNDGQVAGVGRPRELYESPPTPFVASFLGRSSQVPVTPPGDPGLTLAARALAGDGGDRPETDVTCLVRPDDVTLDENGGAGEAHALSGDVARAVDMGTHYEVRVELDAGGELAVETRAEPPQAGERVVARVDRDDLLLFGN